MFEYGMSTSVGQITRDCIHESMSTPSMDSTFVFSCIHLRYESSLVYSLTSSRGHNDKDKEDDIVGCKVVIED